MAKTRRFRAEVVEIHDVDTFKVSIDLGFYVKVEQWLRLRGIDGVELDEERGAEALMFVQEMMPVSTPILIDVELVKTRAGGEDIKWTFRRFVADVTLPGGSDLLDLIRRAGYEKESSAAKSLGNNPGIGLYNTGFEPGAKPAEKPGDPVLGKIVSQTPGKLATSKGCPRCGYDGFTIISRCRCWRGDMKLTCRHCYAEYNFSPTGESHGGAR